MAIDSVIKKRVLNILSYVAASLLTLLLVMLLAGDRFAGILSMLGLYNEGEGIYVDCSKPSARDNRFCNPDKGEVEQKWRSVATRGGNPFSLNGP